MSREGGGRTSIGCPDRGYFEFPSCGGGGGLGSFLERPIVLLGYFMKCINFYLIFFLQIRASLDG